MRGLAPALNRGLDHADGGEAGEARLPGMTAVGGEPRDVAADEVAADLDPAVIAVGGLQPVDRRCRRHVREVARDLGVQRRPVGLDGQEVIRAFRPDRSCDPGLAAHGVDRDQSAGQRQALQQQWDRLDLVGFPGHGLLTQHQTLAAGPSGHEVQRLAPLGAGMAAARGLAVDGDNVGLHLAQRLHPRHEAGLEQLGIERVDHVVQRVVGRDAVPEGQEPAQERQLLAAPQPCLDKVVRPGQGRGQHQQQELR